MRKKDATSLPVLGYWNIRGLAEPARYLLANQHVKYEDRRYHFGPAPGYDFGEWAKAKEGLGLRFSGLPYYLDGDVRLTQSIAIMRYLGRKYKLAGTTEHDTQELDLMEQQVRLCKENASIGWWEPCRPMMLMASLVCVVLRRPLPN